MNIIMEAVQLMETDQSEQAIKKLQNYLLQADDDDKFEIASIYEQWGFMEEAADILVELIQAYPEEGDLLVMLAGIYTEINKDEEAIRLLNKIKEHDEAYIQALVQLADLYQSQGLFEVAEQKLLLAKNIQPDEEIIDFALAELLLSIGDYTRAITFYEKVKSKELAQVVINERLAEAYAATGMYEMALDYFQKQDIHNPDTLFKYGLTASHVNRNDIAIQTWEDVIVKDPYYHSVYYQLAKIYEEEKRVQEAYDTASKGLKRDEFNKDLYFMAGVLAHRLNQDDESEHLVRQAIVLDPDFKEAILFLIEFLKEKEAYSGIVDLLLEIKNTGADDSLYEWELARAYNELESYDNALKYYNEAYNSLNQDSDFLKEYGYFLIEEGRIKEGIRILEFYLKTQPSDFEVDQYVQRIKLE